MIETAAILVVSLIALAALAVAVDALLFHTAAWRQSWMRRRTG